MVCKYFYHSARYLWFIDCFLCQGNSFWVWYSSTFNFACALTRDHSLHLHLLWTILILFLYMVTGLAIIFFFQILILFFHHYLLKKLFLLHCRIELYCDKSVAVCMWANFWILYTVVLFYLLFFMPILCCFNCYVCFLACFEILWYF